MSVSECMRLRKRVHAVLFLKTGGEDDKIPHLKLCMTKMSYFFLIT